MNLNQHNIKSGSLSGPRFDGKRNLLKEPAKGKILTVLVAKKRVTDQLQQQFKEDVVIRFADTYYYLPTRDEIEYIIEESQVERNEWLNDRFDCDDFSFILKGEISSHAYRAEQLTCGLCSGIIWGKFDWNTGYHATNWFLDADEELHFIEPQWDTIHPRQQCRGGVDLVLV